MAKLDNRLAAKIVKDERRRRGWHGRWTDSIGRSSSSLIHAPFLSGLVGGRICDEWEVPGRVTLMVTPLRRLFLAIATLLILSAAPACAGLAPVLAAVTTAIQDSEQALSLIDLAFNAYQAQHPVSAEDRLKYQALLANAYQALNVGTRAVSDAGKIKQGDLDLAFRDFKTAYQALHGFLIARGITPVGSGLVGVGVAGGADFQEPKIFSARVE